MSTPTPSPIPALQRLALLAMAFALLGVVSPALAQRFGTGGEGGASYDQLSTTTQGVEVDEHLGRTLPLELDFLNSEGKRVFLRDYFTDTNKPAIVVMVYYHCPVACQVVMQKLATCLEDVDLRIGKDFRVLYFSFDPTETPKDAAEAKAPFIAGYKGGGGADVVRDWQFHTTLGESSRQLAEAMGFRYRPIANGQFAHPLALFVVSPDGKLTRYIHGLDYPPRDIKLSLIDASAGRLSSGLGDRFMGLCFKYDAKSGKYVKLSKRIMQITGAVMVVGLTTLIGTLLVTERALRRAKARRTQAAAQDGSEPTV